MSHVCTPGYVPHVYACSPGLIIRDSSQRCVVHYRAVRITAERRRRRRASTRNFTLVRSLYKPHTYTYIYAYIYIHISVHASYFDLGPRILPVRNNIVLLRSRPSEFTLQSALTVFRKRAKSIGNRSKHD